MGNRAVIAHKGSPIAVYLHWNGGMDSVKPLLDYCKIAGFPAPSEYGDGFTQLATVAMNFVGDAGSVISAKDMTSEQLDPGDNGIYWIDNDWNIVERETYDGFAEQNVHDYWTMMIEWREVQGRGTAVPLHMLATDRATIEEVSTGDYIYARRNFSTWEKFLVGEEGESYGRKFFYVIPVVDGVVDKNSECKVFDSESIRVINPEKVEALHEALRNREK